MTTIFEVLASQQGDIDMLFRLVHDTAARGAYDQARQRFSDLSAKLLGVMHAEDTIVYPQFARLAGLEDECQRGTREHYKIENLVNHIRLSGLDDGAWHGAVTRLQVMVADHARDGGVDHLPRRAAAHRDGGGQPHRGRVPRLRADGGIRRGALDHVGADGRLIATRASRRRPRRASTSWS